MNAQEELEIEYQGRLDYISELYASEVADLRAEGAMQDAIDAEEAELLLAARLAVFPLALFGDALCLAAEEFAAKLIRDSDPIPF